MHLVRGLGKIFDIFSIPNLMFSFATLIKYLFRWYSTSSGIGVFCRLVKTGGSTTLIRKWMIMKT